MHVRGLYSFALLSVCALAQQIGPASPPPMGLGERARLYTAATVSPGALISSSLYAGFDQLLDAPEEWGQGIDGYGKRFGSSLAGSATSNAIQFGVSALRHEDTRYIRAAETGFWRRAWHVIVSTYIVSNNRGGETFAISRLAGAYGSAVVANSYLPSRLQTPGQTFLRGTTAVAGDMGNNAFKEFWPDIKRKLFRR